MRGNRGHCGCCSLLFWIPLIIPEKVFSLEQTADAHRYLESRRSFGKSVIVL